MQDNELLTISIIPVGTLLFIVMLVVSYIFYIYGWLTVHITMNSVVLTTVPSAMSALTNWMQEMRSMP